MKTIAHGAVFTTSPKQRPFATEPGNVHANIQMMTVSNRPGGHMLQTAESDRRLFWWVLTAISAIAAVVTWIAFGTMA